MSDSYYVWIISRGGGIITTGEHLGVFVSSVEHLSNCPPGWVFVDVNNTTVEQIKEAVAQASKGRKIWPSKENGETPTNVKIRKM